MRRIIVGIGLACLSLVAITYSGCTAAKKSDAGTVLTPVTLMLNWYPEAEHGGFYAAKAAGIFSKYGLDVTIRSGGPNAPVVQELVTGRVQFAIGNADDVLLFREQKAEVVALMAAIQQTPRCILVKKDSPAQSLKDLSGMRLQANAGRPFIDFMKEAGLLDGVEVVPYGGTIANFVNDENTAIQAYSFSEPFLAEEQGVETRNLMLASEGFNPYASCLMTTESLIEEDRDVVWRMTLACCEGWQSYLGSPKRTNAMIAKANEHGMTPEALAFGAKELRTLCMPESGAAADVGTMTPQRWSQLVEQFKKLGLVSDMDPESVFTLEFLPSEVAEEEIAEESSDDNSTTAEAK